MMRPVADPFTHSRRALFGQAGMSEWLKAIPMPTVKFRYPCYRLGVKFRYPCYRLGPNDA